MEETNEPENNFNDTQVPVVDVGKPEAPLTKPKRKHTVPQSQKQKDNFAKARLQRAENIKLKNEAKETEMVKKYVENLAKHKTNAPKQSVKTLPEVPIEEDEQNDEEEDEVVYVKKIVKKRAPIKKAPVKKTPVKKITYVYESDDESDYDNEPEPVISRRVNRAPTPKAPEPEEDYTVYFA
jgi:hypothetical protein